MHNNKTFLAIVPARSGSKGLPDKNIKSINGKPLMAWSIEAGLKSKYIDRLIVSTDSEKYAEIAKYFGAEVPFIRPDNISTDVSSRKDVIKHALDFFRRKNKLYDYIVFLEPTSPLTTETDIDTSIEKLLLDQSAESIVGVSLSEVSHPDFLVNLKNGFLNFINENQKSSVIRRQDLEDLYFYDGTLYISEIDSYLEKEFYHEKTLGYVTPKWKSLEIDDMYDFIMVESIMQYKGYK
jgi:N-acylneuraminate cytidylyltransferase/CMP-N,N'-diacetyllegionaminic acid synthase